MGGFTHGGFEVGYLTLLLCHLLWYADDSTLYVEGNDVNVISKQLTEDMETSSTDLGS